MKRSMRPEVLLLAIVAVILIPLGVQTTEETSALPSSASETIKFIPLNLIGQNDPLAKDLSSIYDYQDFIPVKFIPLESIPENAAYSDEQFIPVKFIPLAAMDNPVRSPENSFVPLSEPGGNELLNSSSDESEIPSKFLPDGSRSTFNSSSDESEIPSKFLPDGSRSTFNSDVTDVEPTVALVPMWYVAANMTPDSYATGYVPAKFVNQSSGTAVLNATCTENEGESDIPSKFLPDGGRDNVAIGKDDTPDCNALMQNYPNPFNPITTIRYQLARKSHVRVDIFNIKGEKIVTLVNRTMPAGMHEVTWDATADNGRKVTSGIYFCQMKSEDFVERMKMIVLR
ncbi:MAG TPA: FlgD immunoglobulin-like domain containing protein [Patescibacteria group bacterium]|nr:FlgD immunoglobulin-like domain containing protein [Patescibacteria group bacterium]